MKHPHLRSEIFARAEMLRFSARVCQIGRAKGSPITAAGMKAEAVANACLDTAEDADATAATLSAAWTLATDATRTLTVALATN